MDRRTPAGKAAAAALLAGIAFALPSGALAATCGDLRAELASLASGNSEYRKWDDAARRQAGALKAAERDASLLGCGGSPASASCAGLPDKIKRMRANLAKIEAKRDRLGKSGRALQIRAEMRAKNCGGEAHAAVRESVRPSGGGLLSFLGFGRERQAQAQPQSAPITASSRHGDDNGSRSRVQYVQRVQYGDPDADDGLVSARFGPGQYRTLCVRTCDGFYFPVSFSTTKYGFGRDEAVCRSMCPAAETQLYVHRNPGETIDALVSLGGEPYGEMPNANLFRTQFVENCTCQGDPGARQTITSLIRSGEAEAGSYLRSDTLEPNILSTSLRDTIDPPAIEVPDGSDPDTELNLTLGYAPQRGSPSIATLGVIGGEDRKNEAQPAAEPQIPAEKRAVRIVGPRYYVAQ
ncbi:DUF2865 domain-containing protein [Stappia sp. F7233]|uniref:DUF2865 domain-containing protein n=1 Tax=Stappia albiluteola TaxID=2758565 RepID=A0A839AI20_9HYPH|nr:DUF2865 domain-containing protein [Stappia albiluteola]MBA5779371.1 DUF2865 domain-containing protein [Stappia albiluteola]